LKKVKLLAWSDKWKGVAPALPAAPWINPWNSSGKDSDEDIRKGKHDPEKGRMLVVNFENQIKVKKGCVNMTDGYTNKMYQYFVYF